MFHMSMSAGSPRRPPVFQDRLRQHHHPRPQQRRNGARPRPRRESEQGAARPIRPFLPPTREEGRPLPRRRRRVRPASDRHLLVLLLPADSQFAANEDRMSRQEGTVKEAVSAAPQPQAMGRKNDLVVWLKLQPAQRRIYEVHWKARSCHMGLAEHSDLGLRMET